MEDVRLYRGAMCCSNLPGRHENKEAIKEKLSDVRFNLKSYITGHQESATDLYQR